MQALQKLSSIYGVVGRENVLCYLFDFILGNDEKSTFKCILSNKYWLTGDRRQTKQFCFLDAGCLVVGETHSSSRPSKPKREITKITKKSKYKEKLRSTE